jgi:hypothetical protein
MCPSVGQVTLLLKAANGDPRQLTRRQWHASHMDQKSASRQLDLGFSLAPCSVQMSDQAVIQASSGGYVPLTCNLLFGRRLSCLGDEGIEARVPVE